MMVRFLELRAKLVGVEHVCEQGLHELQALTTQSKGHGSRHASSTSGIMSVQKVSGTGSWKEIT